MAGTRNAIVGLLADGDSHQGVGNWLGITVNTVRTYFRRIDEKVHVHTNPRPSARPWTAGFAAVLNVGTSLSLAPVLRAYEPLTPEAVAAEVALVREHLHSGFVVGPNLNVCVSAGLQHGFGGGTGQVVQVRLIGYLIDE